MYLEIHSYAAVHKNCASKLKTNTEVKERNKLHPHVISLKAHWAKGLWVKRTTISYSLHTYTYIQPVVPGQTDQLKVDERLEDVYIGDPAERELTQGIVDWDNCLQFDIVRFYVSSQWCDTKFSWLTVTSDEEEIRDPFTSVSFLSISRREVFVRDPKLNS